MGVPDCSVVKDEHLRDVNFIVHDLEVMGSNPGQVELGVDNYFCRSHTY